MLPPVWQCMMMNAPSVYVFNGRCVNENFGFILQPMTIERMLTAGHWKLSLKVRI